MDESDVRVGEVLTDIVVTEGIGPLGPQEVKALVALVLEHVREDQRRDEERRSDTRLRGRAFQPHEG
ncbi:MAG TPA: hypothetical protein VFZ21_08275 [Gemmatimonadaceae bacterium]|nr:hypothetical protein [Gemmatimonadaceae bacterium]